MAASTYGKRYSVEYLREECFLTREGVSLLGITEAAQKIGFETLSAKLTVEKLCENPDLLPCILHWNQNHFVVLYRIVGAKNFSPLHFNHSCHAGANVITRFATAYFLFQAL
jgi:ATP-binding cassette subfamily B protein